MAFPLLVVVIHFLVKKKETVRLVDKPWRICFSPIRLPVFRARDFVPPGCPGFTSSETGYNGNIAEMG
jgi:hypothetical protein